MFFKTIARSPHFTIPHQSFKRNAADTSGRLTRDELQRIVAKMVG
ncbi:hypothetical protein [Novosphingobium sp. CCH12-A3]|nr:hypothetical protein [Novosphingobium sp. CCH12-A3]